MPARVGLGLTAPRVGAGLPDVPGWPGDTRRALRGLCGKARSRGVPCQAQASVSNGWELFTKFASFRDLSPMAAFWCPRPCTRSSRGPRAPRKPESVPKSRGGLSIPQRYPALGEQRVPGRPSTLGRSGGQALCAPGWPPHPHPAPRAPRSLHALFKVIAMHFFKRKGKKNPKQNSV